MINFCEFDDKGIILFIKNNKDEFSKNFFDSNFVIHAMEALEEERLKILKSIEGFVTGYIGSPKARRTNITSPVTIDFIYVAPEHQRKGIARKLLSEFLENIPSHRAIELFCEGSDRKEKFIAMGFKLVEENNNFFTLKLDTKNDLIVTT